MSQQRKAQGWINYRRRPLLVALFVGLIVYWVLVPEPWPLVPEQWTLLKAGGFLLVAIGGAGRIVAALTIASHKNRQVVDVGLHSVMRHPLYFFSFLLVMGVAPFTERLDVGLLMGGIFLLFFFPMMLNEEKYLKNLFGAHYVDYTQRVPRFLPNFAKWRAPEEMTINLKLVIQTAFDASVAALLIVLFEVVHYVSPIFIE